MNAAGLTLIKQNEGCRLVAYRDVGGVLTIGYGHTGTDVYDGQTITQAQADSLLATDVGKFEETMREMLGATPTTDNQLNALVSLAYNVGVGAVSGSTVMRQHRLGNELDAAKAFVMWDHAAARELKPLLRRRLQEAALYLT